MGNFFNFFPILEIILKFFFLDFFSIFFPDSYFLCPFLAIFGQSGCQLRAQPRLRLPFSIPGGSTWNANSQPENFGEKNDF